jgi:hypothetical protein
VSTNDGVLGQGNNGVHGVAQHASGTGVLGENGFNAPGGAGVVGSAVAGPGVSGTSTSGPGVAGTSDSGAAIAGSNSNVAGWAGLFDGNVEVRTGSLTVAAGTTSCGKIEAASVTVSGAVSAADVVLSGADFAEEFDLSDGSIQPGTVVIVDDQGTLSCSVRPYDKRVAGVLSGAGSFRPGVTMDHQADSSGPRGAVALLGKVFCKVDASYGAIETGDLLTTSATEGHAMKASDAARSFGTVIGKALAPLQEGRDLLPVLVNLQ